MTGFGFRLADVEVPGLRDVVKISGKVVETFGGVADNGHVIGIEQDLDEFEEFISAPVFDVEFAVRGVLECVQGSF